MAEKEAAILAGIANSGDIEPVEAGFAATLKPHTIGSRSKPALFAKAKNGPPPPLSPELAGRASKALGQTKPDQSR